MHVYVYIFCWHHFTQKCMLFSKRSSAVHYGLQWKYKSAPLIGLGNSVWYQLGRVQGMSYNYHYCWHSGAHNKADRGAHKLYMSCKIAELILGSACSSLNMANTSPCPWQQEQCRSASMEYGAMCVGESGQVRMLLSPANNLAFHLLVRMK